MEEKRKSILRSLEADLASVSEQTTAFETRFTAATKVLDQLKSGNTMSCSNSIGEFLLLETFLLFTRIDKLSKAIKI